ncbi:MAG: von Willebrand factor type A domain-containing protein [Myxococcota bacterium]
MFYARLALPAVLGLALVGCGGMLAMEPEVLSGEDEEFRGSGLQTHDIAPAPADSAPSGSTPSASAPPQAEPAPEPMTSALKEESVVGGAPVEVGGLMGDDLSGQQPAIRGRRLEAKHKTAGAKSGLRADNAFAGERFPPPPPPPPQTAPAPVETQTEVYTDYGINGFTLTERDGLSTFAADVDTASYTISRRKLRDGYLPPAAAVRVEEFVNYFPYEYAQPKAGHPFAVDVEAAPSPYNPQNHLVRIGVQGKKVQFDTRKAVNLTFLVDVSGSMQSRDKIGMLKDTLRMLTNELEDGDTVALVTYAGATKVVLAPTPISQKGRIISALDGLTAGGSTAMGAGINLAYAQAELGFRAGAVNRVIVASDGDANVGATSHTQLSGFISAKAKKGITLTTLGFGNGNYKDTMMERLANDGDGNYYYIDSLQESRRLFVDQLSSTLEVIAKDVKLQVEFNPETVLAYRLIGYENRDIADRDFRNDAVDAGEIGAGHQVTALYEVALRDDASGGLGTVRVRNKAPGPDSPAVERRYDVPSSILQSSFADSSKQFRIQTAAVGFAEILRGSPHMNEISLRQVANIARDAKRVEYNEDTELVELIDRAARLRGEGAVSRR